MNTFNFTFVRNPYNRMMSLFGYLKNIRFVKRNKGEDCTFEQFINDVINPNGTTAYNSFRKEDWSITQYDYCYNKSGKKKMDFIGKYENLQEDFKVLMDKFGINPEEYNLPHIYSGHMKLKSYVNHPMFYEFILMVNKLYPKDFDIFGYKKIKTKEQLEIFREKI